MRAAKVVLAATLFATLLAHVGYRPIVNVLGQLDWWWLPLLLAIRVIALFVQSQRWRLFLASHDIRTSSWRLFRSYWIARFFSSFSPGQLGGDAYRILRGVDPGAKRTQVAGSVLIERVSGLIGLMLVVAGIGYLHFDVIEPAGLQFLPTAAATGAVVLLILAITKTPAGWGLAMAQTLPASRISSIISEIFRAFVVHVDRPGTLAIGVILGIAFYFVLGCETLLAFRALEVEVDPLLVWLIVPTIALVSSIPITINGWGTTEAAIFLFYTQLGVSDPAAISIAFLTRLSSTLMIACGGVILLAEYWQECLPFWFRTKTHRT